MQDRNVGGSRTASVSAATSSCDATVGVSVACAPCSIDASVDSLLCVGRERVRTAWSSRRGPRRIDDGGFSISTKPVRCRGPRNVARRYRGTHVTSCVDHGDEGLIYCWGDRRPRRARSHDVGRSSIRRRRLIGIGGPICRPVRLLAGVSTRAYSTCRRFLDPRNSCSASATDGSSSSATTRAIQCSAPLPRTSTAAN